MARKFFLSSLLLGLLLAGWFLPVQAQQDEFSLTISRTFGYSSGSQIRGSFNLGINKPQNIKSVTYLIDGQVMAQTTSAPFNLALQTADYAIGWHDLNAIVETQDGSKVTTSLHHVEFVSADQETSGMLNILVPLLGGVFLLIVIVVGFQMFAMRNKPKSTLPLGAPRRYGFRGGSICPHCHRAVALHWWAMNIGLGTKFDRCDFCGQWSILKALGSTELDAAVAAEQQMAQPVPLASEKSKEEILEDLIKKSRYIDP